VRTGDVRADLLSLLRPWARLVRKRPYGRVIAALVTEAQTDPAFAAQYREQFVVPRRAAAREILEDAVARGALPATIDVDVALDLLYGPLYHRLLHGHAPITEAFVDDLVQTVVAGLEATSPRGRERVHTGGSATPRRSRPNPPV
jgi:hypothetical protein